MRAILAIDTSSQSTGVALCVDGRVVAASALVKAYRHSENLFARVDEVLSSGGVSRKALTGIAVTRGPGSFTGLRVGIATAKGLAFGLGLPIAGVSSLRALASAHIGFKGVVAAAVDAKKNQVYAAAYSSEGYELIPEGAFDPGNFASRLAGTGHDVILTGTGAGVYEEAFRKVLGAGLTLAPESAWEIDPGQVALLGYGEFIAGRDMEASRLLPSYLRRSEAEEKAGIVV